MIGGTSGQLVCFMPLSVRSSPGQKRGQVSGGLLGSRGQAQADAGEGRLTFPQEDAVADFSHHGCGRLSQSPPVEIDVVGGDARPVAMIIKSRCARLRRCWTPGLGFAGTRGGSMVWWFGVVVECGQVNGPEWVAGSRGGWLVRWRKCWLGSRLLVFVCLLLFVCRWSPSSRIRGIAGGRALGKRAVPPPTPTPTIAGWTVPHRPGTDLSGASCPRQAAL